MAKLPFSKRGKPQPDKLRYDVPEQTRSRVLAVLQEVCQTHGDIDGIFHDIYQNCQKHYGGMRAQNRGPHRTIVDVVHEHWFSCNDEEFIDAIEWFFESRFYGGAQFGVDAVNEVLRQEFVGYEFSPYVVVTEENDRSIRSYVSHLPEATKKTNELLHSTTVMPTLQLLSGKRWEIASQVMMQAQRHLREGNWSEAIHLAGRCLESVLKTICDAKGWAFKPDKDTLNVLLQTCSANGLFDKPYLESIQRTSGDIRNKWGGHGQAHSPYGPVRYESAEHMIHVTSAHILYLARQAKMA